MKRSAIEFNKLMSQNEIIASVRQFMDEDDRLKERKDWSKSKLLNHLNDSIVIYKKLKKELVDLDKASTELTNLTREKQVIECDYHIALCEEDLRDIINKTKTLKMC
ncbi:hypothetical protein OAP72_02485 [Flavobacteriaceae bacterium]|jgi:hypothetical protein|nr:hypothetical protein [Flavobacteriaceae bacterium]MDC0858195.1 hypothetical protein [Flavobacteriaceae bacterium]